MISAPYVCLPLAEIPVETGWLSRQPHPVIAFGDGATPNADVVLADESATEQLQFAIKKSPCASLALVQVLRVVERLSLEDAMTVESLAYASLQSGPEHRLWLHERTESAQQVVGDESSPILIERNGDVVSAELNRPQHRNSLSVEMRDALIELFELIIADRSIERVQIRGRGSCFSVGGELREFGLTPDSATAHRIRSMHNPSRLLVRCADRVSVHLHSACIGSGLELPAFASHVSAEPKTFFQLPELAIGLIPGAGGCVSVSRRIGRQRTAWLALSGKKINATTALQWGLIDEVVSKSSP